MEKRIAKGMGGYEKEKDNSRDSRDMDTESADWGCGNRQKNADNMFAQKHHIRVKCEILLKSVFLCSAHDENRIIRGE